MRYIDVDECIIKSISLVVAVTICPTENNNKPVQNLNVQR
jgi:hypothetical protein